MLKQIIGKRTDRRLRIDTEMAETSMEEFRIEHFYTIARPFVSSPFHSNTALERAWPDLVGVWTDMVVVEYAFMLAFIQGLDPPPLKPMMKRLLTGRNQESRSCPSRLYGFLSAGLHVCAISLEYGISFCPQTQERAKAWLSVFSEALERWPVNRRNDDEDAIPYGINKLYTFLSPHPALVDIPLTEPELYMLPFFQPSHVQVPFRVMQHMWMEASSDEQKQLFFVHALDPAQDSKEVIDYLTEKCPIWAFWNEYVSKDSCLYYQIPASHSSRLARVYGLLVKKHDYKEKRKIDVPFRVEQIIKHHPHLWFRVIVDTHRSKPLHLIKNRSFTRKYFKDFSKYARAHPLEVIKNRAFAKRINNVRKWSLELGAASIMQERTALFSISSTDMKLWKWWNKTKRIVDERCLQPISMCVNRTQPLVELILSFIL